MLSNHIESIKQLIKSCRKHFVVAQCGAVWTSNTRTCRPLAFDHDFRKEIRVVKNQSSSTRDIVILTELRSNTSLSIVKSHLIINSMIVDSSIILWFDLEKLNFLSTVTKFTNAPNGNPKNNEVMRHRKRSINKHC